MEVDLEMDIVRKSAHLPVGCRLAHFTTNWQRISNNPWSQSTISGCKLEFWNAPQQAHRSRGMQLNSEKVQMLSRALEELTANGATITAQDSSGSFFSSMFLVPKPDRSWCPVIDLQSLNRFVVTPHLKVKSIRIVKELLHRGDWLAKLDLMNAYIPHSSHSQISSKRYTSGFIGKAGHGNTRSFCLA